MKKVAIFGNAGGGKSTLSRALAQHTGLPLHTLDKLAWLPGGVAVPPADYRRAHSQILTQERWLIDGYGCPETLWQRLDAADTLIHIDLPLPLHGWQVIKRLLKGLFSAPEGWPERSPMWRSTLSSYRVLLPCRRLLTPRYRAYCEQAAATRRVYQLRSRAEIRNFLATLEPG
ncbi:adenylate kinase [Halieaceae bacterium IMCC14734]|uniref:Adenylate kinase n=1 Tax=Candidatus Litorirhabdus singularis TaxID=2518993 RepID=A0ABT3TD92_9GAMM|nr:adenylate kinase [Candidatus Litorirhabdus singularis]MCX2980272.1 adenylate kinase [Candidatus Litorirhabdus singularis]